MARPDIYPEWGTDSEIVEPLEGKKREGYRVGDPVRAQHENWRANLIDQWVRHLDERAFEAQWFTRTLPLSNWTPAEWPDNALGDVSGLIYANDPTLAGFYAVAGQSILAWVQQRDPRFVLAFESATNLSDIAYLPNAPMWVAVGRRNIALSDNGGSWSDIPYGLSEIEWRGVHGGYTGATDHGFAIVGDGGNVSTFFDGVQHISETGTEEDLLSVTFARELERWVAVGRGGTMITSDLANWRTEWSRVRAGGADLHSVTWNGRVFVAVGAGGTLLTSADGLSWNAHTSSTSLTLEAVASDPRGTLVASGSRGVVVASFDDGQSWHRLIEPGGDPVLSLAHAGDQWLAGHALGGVIATLRQPFPPTP